MPMSPVVNGRRRKKRIVAVFTALHLCGLPLDERAEVVVELKKPLADPLLPEQDHLFPIPSQPEPDLSAEPIFSIYSQGKDGRLIVPLSSIKSLTLLREKELGSRPYEDAQEGLPAQAAAYRRTHAPDSGAGYLLFSRSDSKGEPQDIVLACLSPRQLRRAEQALRYYREHIHSSGD